MLVQTAWNIQIEVPYIRQWILFIYLFTLAHWRRLFDNAAFLW